MTSDSRVVISSSPVSKNSRTPLPVHSFSQYHRSTSKNDLSLAISICLSVVISELSSFFAMSPFFSYLSHKLYKNHFLNGECKNKCSFIQRCLENYSVILRIIIVGIIKKILFACLKNTEITLSD